MKRLRISEAFLFLHVTDVVRDDIPHTYSFNNNAKGEATKTIMVVKVNT